jgi:hypothetical protein
MTFVGKVEQLDISSHNRYCFRRLKDDCLVDGPDPYLGTSHITLFTEAVINFGPCFGS